MKTNPSKQLEQRQFAFTNWGGKRRGAGRKPKGEQAGVSHAKRPQLKRRFPVLVTQRLRRGLPSLRSTAEFRVIEAALVASTKDELRVVEFSVQTNHLHLIVEAEDELALSRRLKGLFVRIARRLNKLWKRRGNVFPDRYHARILTTPREVRHALVYVLGNARKHRSWSSAGPDPYSSGATFDGWRLAPASTMSADSVPRRIARARTWLLGSGWRRHGLIDPREAPASSKTRRTGAADARRRRGNSTTAVESLQPAQAART